MSTNPKCVFDKPLTQHTVCMRACWIALWSQSRVCVCNLHNCTMGTQFIKQVQKGVTCNKSDHCLESPRHTRTNTVDLFLFGQCPLLPLFHVSNMSSSSPPGYIFLIIWGRCWHGKKDKIKAHWTASSFLYGSFASFKSPSEGAGRRTALSATIVCVNINKRRLRVKRLILFSGFTCSVMISCRTWPQSTNLDAVKCVRSPAACVCVCVCVCVSVSECTRGETCTSLHASSCPSVCSNTNSDTLLSRSQCLHVGVCLWTAHTLKWLKERRRRRVGWGGAGLKKIK